MSSLFSINKQSRKELITINTQGNDKMLSTINSDKNKFLNNSIGFKLQKPRVNSAKTVITGYGQYKANADRNKYILTDLDKNTIDANNNFRHKKMISELNTIGNNDKNNKTLFFIPPRDPIVKKKKIKNINMRSFQYFDRKDFYYN